ncbi:unnamed protein product [Amoebophrya sp. A25]|nr:unnamed protein product [Amoebophrya sp. A25]|eukprot:GSA25T00002460001.1
MQPKIDILSETPVSARNAHVLWLDMETSMASNGSSSTTSATSSSSGALDGDKTSDAAGTTGKLGQQNTGTTSSTGVVTRNSFLGAHRWNLLQQYYGPRGLFSEFRHSPPEQAAKLPVYSPFLEYRSREFFDLYTVSVGVFTEEEPWLRYMQDFESEARACTAQLVQKRLKPAPMSSTRGSGTSGGSSSSSSGTTSCTREKRTPPAKMSEADLLGEEESGRSHQARTCFGQMMTDVGEGEQTAAEQLQSGTTGGRNQTRREAQDANIRSMDALPGRDELSYSTGTSLADRIQQVARSTSNRRAAIQPIIQISANPDDWRDYLGWKARDLFPPVAATQASVKIGVKRRALSKFNGVYKRVELFKASCSSTEGDEQTQEATLVPTPPPIFIQVEQESSSASSTSPQQPPGQMSNLESSPTTPSPQQPIQRALFPFYGSEKSDKIGWYLSEVNMQPLIESTSRSIPSASRTTSSSPSTSNPSSSSEPCTFRPYSPNAYHQPVLQNLKSTMVSENSHYTFVLENVELGGTQDWFALTQHWDSNGRPLPLHVSKTVVSPRSLPKNGQYDGQRYAERAASLREMMGFVTKGWVRIDIELS